MKIQPYIREVYYYETDKMGIVHHSNYIRWFEEARIDFLEKIGCGMFETEKAGIISPVLNVSAKYILPARFGSVVAVRPEITFFNGVRLKVKYTVNEIAFGTPTADRAAGLKKVFSENPGQLLVTGISEHCFTSPDLKVLNLRKANAEIFAKLSEQSQIAGKKRRVN